MFWKYLIVLLISMIPLIELRGAIPVAVGMDLGLPEWAVLITAIIGNIVPVPLIYLFARKFLEWGSKKKWKPLHQFCNFCLKKAKRPVKNSSRKLVIKVLILLSFSLSLSLSPVPALGLVPSPLVFLI